MLNFLKRDQNHVSIKQEKIVKSSKISFISEATEQRVTLNKYR